MPDYHPQNALERAIVSDSWFQLAVRLGRPRRGHPEGNLGTHIMQVLAAIDGLGVARYRSRLRIVALLHDIGKFALF